MGSPRWGVNSGAGRPLGWQCGFISIVIAILAAGAASCRRNGTGAGISDESFERLEQRLRAEKRWVAASMGGGKVRYLGFSIDREPAKASQSVALTHYWQCLAPLPEPYQVFVHFTVQGARGWIPNGDHDPPLSFSLCPTGGIMVDEHEVRLGPMLPGDRVDVHVGLFRGNRRLPVDDPAVHDGGQRIRAGSFAVRGMPVPLPEYSAPQLTNPMAVDGVLEEAGWREVPWTHSFAPAHGRGGEALHTRAKMAWTPTTLYVAMEATDPDIQAVHRQRDDPIYRLEALEIMIDPDGRGQSYVELQVSPLGTQFDAAFSGGARRGMNRSYDARVEVAVSLQGTVGDERDLDQSWRAEWGIEVASIPGAGDRLESGTCWRVNLFRVGKDRTAKGVTRDESAWSPSLMGDFHNLERFGRVCFN